MMIKLSETLAIATTIIVAATLILSIIISNWIGFTALSGIATTISAIATVFIALATIAFAATAWLGLSNWQEQHKTRMEHDLARDILRSLHLYRESIKDGRIKFHTLHTATNPVNREDLKDVDKLSEKLELIRTEIEVYLVEAKIYWGGALAKITEKILIMEMLYIMTLQQKIMITNPHKNMPPEIKEYIARVKPDYEENSWMLESGSENKFDEQIDKLFEDARKILIKKIENILKPDSVKADKTQKA